MNSCYVPPVTPVVTPPVTPPPATTPTVSPIVTTAPTGGGGQIYCSSPTAPGWNVSLPNGGCNTTPMATSVPLNILPYTGYNPAVDIMGFVSLMFVVVCITYLLVYISK